MLYKIIISLYIQVRPVFKKIMNEQPIYHISIKYNLFFPFNLMSRQDEIT